MRNGKFVSLSVVFLLSITLISSPVVLAQSGTNSDWSNFTSEDKMSGKIQAYATSKWVESEDPMDFPYEGTEGLLGFGCDGEDEWAYIKFTNQPNITNDEPQDGGYSTFYSRVKWDTVVKAVEFTQEWGSESINFVNDERAIENIRKRGKMLLELDWHGEGKVYFEFSLDGSAANIRKARQICGDERS